MEKADAQSRTRESRASGFWSRNSVNLVLLPIVLIATLGLFSIEIITAEQASPLSEIVFRLSESFGLLILAILADRVATREENLKSLKREAIKAYRRITDIGKSVQRIRNEILRIDLAHHSNEVPKQELGVLRVIAEEMSETVASSVSDWADIIGEEISKAEQLRGLQVELATQAGKRNSEEAAATRERIAELKSEIAALRTQLPYALLTEAQPPDDILPREGRFSEKVWWYYDDIVRKTGSLVLEVALFGDVLSDEGLRSSIENGPPFRASIEPDMSKWHVIIYLNDGTSVGEIENPFDDVYGNDFAHTLLSLLPLSGPEDHAMGKSAGRVIEGSRVEAIAVKSGKFTIQVPITHRLKA